MPRGRPPKVKKEISESENMEELDEVVKIEPKKVDARVPRNTVPIKYNEDLARDIRAFSMISSKTTEILINQSLLMIDWFVNTLDGLDNSGYFIEDGGWRKKFGVIPPRVNLKGK